MRRVLGLAAGAGGASAAICVDGECVAERRIEASTGLAALLPPMVAELLEQAGPVDGIAVCVGPGSFTALRAAISLAQGLGLAAGIAVIGVTAAEALGEACGDTAGRERWAAIHARAGHVVLDIDGRRELHALDALPRPAGPVAILGDAAREVTAALAARGANVMLTGARQPLGADVARIGRRRAEGALPSLEALPLYSEAPLARQAGATVAA